MTSGWTSPSSISASQRPSGTQPRAHPEDLLCAYVQAYVAPLRLAYSATFGPRRIGVVSPSRRTIVDIERVKDEKLEVTAQ
jgi:hypothetical protein